jgi:two-component system cell cycle sensor histidine kinase/response regulator CckA
MPSRVLPFTPAAAKRAPERPPVRVLIVDDDEAMRQFVETVLRGAGYETALGADGEDAIRLAGQSASFDLLVTDEMMPRMAGHQLARYMRRRYRGIKVLYLSAFREELFKEKGSLWDDEAFLDKPCTPEMLLDAVSRLLFGALVDRSPDQR